MLKERRDARKHGERSREMGYGEIRRITIAGRESAEAQQQNQSVVPHVRPSHSQAANAGENVERSVASRVASQIREGRFTGAIMPGIALDCNLQPGASS